MSYGIATPAGIDNIVAPAQGGFPATGTEPPRLILRHGVLGPSGLPDASRSTKSTSRAPPNRRHSTATGADLRGPGFPGFTYSTPSHSGFAGLLEWPLTPVNVQLPQDSTPGSSHLPDVYQDRARFRHGLLRKACRPRLRIHVGRAPLPTGAICSIRPKPRFPRPPRE